MDLSLCKWAERTEIVSEGGATKCTIGLSSLPGRICVGTVSTRRGIRNCISIIVQCLLDGLLAVCRCWRIHIYWALRPSFSFFLAMPDVDQKGLTNKQDFRKMMEECKNLSLSGSIPCST